MKHLPRLTRTAIAVLVVTFVTQGVVWAQISQDPKANARHSRVVGLWDVEVIVSDCDTGETLSSFIALHKYDLGGTGQVVPSSSPTALSAHMMIWSHVRNNDYQMTLKMYRFGPTGNYVGWNVISNEVSISEDAQEYAGSGVAEIFDAAGNSLGTLCPSFLGTRFTGE